MEDFKSALKTQCNDNFAQCNVISCETRVWKTSFPNKHHICHGNTYDDLEAYWAPKHASQIAEMTKAIAKAHNDYADSTSSKDPTSSKGGHSGGTPKAKINPSVQTLFDSAVYPTYMKNKEVFDNEAKEIGGMDNEECISKYNQCYIECENDASVKSMDQSDTSAVSNQIKKLHTEMNAKVRKCDQDATAMVDILKQLFKSV
jgi:hypothetical protein